MGFAKSKLFAMMSSGSGSGTVLPMAHLEEAVEDGDEFLDMGKNKSAIWHILATDFLMEVLADEHLL
jgi:hypothetical protein